MVLGGFFLSFCFGRCAVIVGRLDANNAARADQLEQITEFIKDVELPKTLARNDGFQSKKCGEQQPMLIVMVMVVVILIAILIISIHLSIIN
eukprot:gene12568-15791_t